MPSGECHVPRVYSRYVFLTGVICCAATFIVLRQCACECEDQIQSGKFVINNVPTDEPLTEDQLPTTYLAVVILSSPSEMRRRDTIRRTWLKLSAKGPDVVWHCFPVGLKGLSNEEVTALRREQADHGDLLLLETHQERYNTLASKMRATIKSLTQRIRCNFLLKVDADSFVRLGVLLKALKDVSHPMLYWGFLDGRGMARRKGKWRETEWVLCDRYLPYAFGGGYVLSWALVDYIARNSYLLKIYNNEDVAIGAWLAGLNVRYVHDPRFDTEFKSRGCSNEYLITHKQTEVQMKEKFDLLKNKGQLCKREHRDRASYIYDWSVPPSLCCKRTNDSSVP